MCVCLFYTLTFWRLQVRYVACWTARYQRDMYNAQKREHKAKQKERKYKQITENQLHHQKGFTLQYTTVHYNTLQYTTVHYSTLQYTTTHYSTLRYSTLQHEIPGIKRMHGGHARTHATHKRETAGSSRSIYRRPLSLGSSRLTKTYRNIDGNDSTTSE